MKIAVAGTGYVGMSMATLLSVNNVVIALDVISEKVDKINNRISPIKDDYIEEYFKKNLNLKATLDYKEAFENSDYIIISTPTNYDEKLNFFDTSSIEQIIQQVIELNLTSTTMVIKSTIPVGFVESMKKKYNIENIMFSPEFLREGNALYDNLYPSRIIVGEKSSRAEKFANLLKEASLKNDVEVLFMNSTEAEAVKLFSNAYLALRVSYFNELDTYAKSNNLDSKSIIDGVCFDPRIGNNYNNPSFGYGGYCFPKDTKQLLANYDNIPQNIIEAIVKSNDTRKDYIANDILSTNSNVIGIYRLTMKKNSDNFRASAIFDVIEKLKNSGKKIVIYEPTIKETTFNDYEVISDFEGFEKITDIIIANRIDEVLESCIDKVYTRDIYQKD